MVLRVLILLTLLTFLWQVPRTYKRTTHAFRPAKVELAWPSTPQWEIAPLGAEKERELQSILRQPFSYLAKGKQAFVFQSSDGKYVLKLFKFDETPLRNQQVRNTFNSCKLAWDRAADLTGLVFIHLNPKEGSLPLIRVKNRLGFPFRIDPAHVRFILQRKADPFLPAMQKARQNHNESQLLHSLHDLLNRFAALDLANYDPKLESNYGFIDGQAILLDVGKIKLDPTLALSQRDYFISAFQLKY